MEVDPTGVVAPTDSPGAPIAVDQPPTAKPAAKPAQDEPQTLRDAFGRRTIKHVDAEGVEREFPALRLRDISDLEEMIGGIGDFWSADKKIGHSGIVVWLSARNIGMTMEQRRARAWTTTREDVDDWSIGSILDTLALAADILRITGFKIDISAPGAAKRPLVEGPPASTGENSSPAASPAA